MTWISRRRLITWACLLAIPLISAPHRARAAEIAVCSEAEFDRALANAADGDTIRFGCSGTINFRSQKEITKSITLDGSGQQVTLSGQRRTQLLYVNPKLTVTIRHLTFADARVSISGGAIDNYGTLTISDSIFTRNTHAISNFGALAIEDTAFVDNVVNGIYNRRSVTITRSLFTGNGHGIDNDYGKVIAVNSTFANNRFTLPNGVGAGIANSGTVTLINSTFTGNEAPAGGGAIATHLGGTVTLINTIIANSVPAKNCFGPMIDGGHNLQYPGTSCGESIPTTDPKLLTLADNGGITLSVGLSTDSPAVGAGDPEQCTTSAVNNEDQRGMIRIAAGDTSCDIGAFELQAPLITAPNRFAIVSFQPR